MNRTPENNGDNATPHVPNPEAPSLEVQLEDAVEHHRAGRLFEAEQIYRRILAVDPDYPYALCLLGTVAQATGEYDQAIDLIARAIAVKPDYVDAYCNLGTALMAMARFEDALAGFEQALALNPDYAEAHNNKGVVLRKLERLDDAVESYRRAIETRPEYAEAHFNLGNALNEMGRLDDAIESYRKTIVLKPEHAEAHHNLGRVLRDRGQPIDAVASYRRAIEIRPEYAEAHNNLGFALQEQGMAEKALDSFRKALAINPDSVKALANLGNALKDLGRLDEAAAEYGKSLAADPKYAEVHYNLGLVYLLTGDFDNGWREYNWRWRMQDFSSRRAENDKPLWDGGNLSGKTILLYPEQGHGDAVQFSRYAPMVAARGGRVALEAPAPLARLFETLDGVDRLIESMDPPQPYDCHAPLMDLPRLFATSLDTIPHSESYLSADSDLTRKWSDWFESQDGIRVGIAWAGNPVHRNDRNRSMDPALLRPLTEVPGISLFSLQVGVEKGALHRIGDEITDTAPFLTDFAETAAVMVNLDLVIGVDTSVVHVAGALGRPVWTLLPYIPDWRWLMDRDDSPWYPSMRLFRQSVPGDWNEVVERVCVALSEWAETPRN